MLRVIEEKIRESRGVGRSERRGVRRIERREGTRRHRGFLASSKNEKIHEAVEKSYFELMKKKYENPGESEEPKESEKPKELEEPMELEEPKESEEESDLHAIKKFKIDEDTFREISQKYGGRDREVLEYLAKYLTKYFENNAEMLKYIQKKSYVSVRIKVKFLKDGEEQVDEYFVPHGHERKCLANS
jgi:hypothetical protein